MLGSDTDRHDLSYKLDLVPSHQQCMTLADTEADPEESTGRSGVDQTPREEKKEGAQEPTDFDRLFALGRDHKARKSLLRLSLKQDRATTLEAIESAV